MSIVSTAKNGAALAAQACRFYIAPSWRNIPP
jgi:hypothetical protein